MKKTIITLMAAALGTAGVAQAAVPGASLTILTGAGANSLTHTAVLSCTNIPNTANKNYLIDAAMGTTGISLSLQGDTNCKMWAVKYSTTSPTWTNTAAITEMSGTLGMDITAEGLNAVGFSQPGNANSHLETITLDFGTTSGYAVGSHVILYTTISGTSKPTSLSVNSGLSDATVSYASAGDNGFVSSIDGSVAGSEMIIARVEGELSATSLVLNLSGGNKSGIGMIAIVPEPATATLSLLALAGLATRRRRK